MSEEDYDKREGTLRSLIKEQKAKDPNWVEPWNKTEGAGGTTAAPASSDDVPPGPESVEGMKVGQRCEINPGSRRGTVAFVGEIEEMAPGFWVGVRFDEPVGRGDGKVKGRVVFEALARYGGFIRPANVTVGDFPERDIMAELDDSDDEI